MPKGKPFVKSALWVACIATVPLWCQCGRDTAVVQGQGEAGTSPGDGALAQGDSGSTLGDAETASLGADSAGADGEADRNIGKEGGPRDASVEAAPAGDACATQPSLCSTDASYPCTGPEGCPSNSACCYLKSVGTTTCMPTSYGPCSLTDYPPACHDATNCAGIACCPVAKGSPISVCTQGPCP